MHIVNGRDENGKIRVAKGWIAIGQFAIGVIAIGQFGIGILFGIGQLAIGSVAIGQFAIGGLFGGGQFATGLIAMGQYVVGYYGLAYHGIFKFRIESRFNISKLIEHINTTYRCFFS